MVKKTSKLTQILAAGAIIGQFFMNIPTYSSALPKDYDSYKEYQVTSDDNIAKFLELTAKIKSLKKFEGTKEEEKIKQYQLQKRKIIKEVGEKLENLVESDIYSLTSIDVDINSELKSGGIESLLILSRKDALGIEDFIAYGRLLSEEEEDVIKYLAEMVGPNYARAIKTNNKEFKELASIFTKYKLCTNTIEGETIEDCDGVKAKVEKLKQEIFRKSKIPADIEERGYSKKYSALPTTSGGKNNGIRTLINATINDFYYLIAVYGHESGHHIIAKHESLKDGWAFSYSGVGYEESVIEETACNLFGDAIATEFKENHLKEDVKLKEGFSDSQKYYHKKYKKRQDVLEEILQLYEERKIEQASKALKNANLTASKLSLMNLYSGNKKIVNKLTYLKNELGDRIFIELIDNLDNNKELEKAVNLVKSGVKDQETLEKEVGIYK